jgi:phage terminase small subunit
MIRRTDFPPPRLAVVPRKRRKSKRDPVPPPESPRNRIPLAAPEWLDADARAEWERLAPTLHATGHVTSADHAVFVVYCRAWAEYARDARAEVPATGDRRDRLQLNVIRAAGALGLTPTTRPKVLARPAASASKWAGALK